MNIENVSNGEVRSNMIMIKYNYVPRYCDDCKMQGHSNEDCRMRKVSKQKEVQEQPCINEGEESRTVVHNPPLHRPYVSLLQKGKARVLSSGRVVGDPSMWKVVKGGHMKIPTEQQPVSITNAFEVLSTHTHIEQSLDPANKASTKIITTPHKGIEGERLSAKAWVLESFGQKAPTPVIEPEQQFIEGLEPVISAGALVITNNADVSPRIMKSGPFDTIGAFLLLTLAVVAILMKSYFDRDCLS